ncbi:molybdopterin-dependent oxidoreductase [uncultured Adlercreutzia sp.]|uniref:molybdopterin-dependent oxidoreductase n=1 Tax=uncultured Adlercreutzia sp. TaxID=875803 RepID=UPI0025A4E9B8|nr:molybdopterin-dependent oxidoreductase [uncultured Adlercreutzia sp.]
MSGARNSTLTRRSFLKTTGSAAAGLACVGAAGAALSGEVLSPATANAAGEEKTVYTLHQFMCQGNCSIKCTVRDGHLAMIEPSDAVAPKYQRCCMKGLSEIEHVYSPLRLQAPLKRVGERGEGNFEKISWDEAMEIVGSELKKAWDAYGKGSVYISASNEPRFGMLASILGAGTGVEPGIDRGIGNGVDPAIGGGGFASCTNETRDWVNAKTIILGGINFLETSLMRSDDFFDAKRAGAEIIVVDPHFSTTASKANQWIPLKPGTDGALYLAMISHIIDNRWYDEEYMLAHTSMPFLVDVASGQLLRGGKTPETDPAAGEAAEPTDYLVWDTVTNRPVPYDDPAAVPALEGTYEVNGAQAAPVFEQLKASQREYTTAWAAEKCDIDQEVIEQLAEKYATGGPAYLCFGYGGSDKFSNPDIQGHAMVILTALTGQIGKPGAALGHPGGGQGYGAALAAWPLPEGMVPAEIPVRADRFADTDAGVHVIISLGNTLQQYYANMNKTRTWLDSLDFILHVGMYDEDSVAFADVVLPVCSKFEDTVEHSIVRGGYNHIQLSQKCIDPLFEALPDYDVMYRIAQSVGLESVLPADAEELARFSIDNADDPLVAGITFDALVKNNNTMPLAGIEEPRIGFADLQFPTPTGRMEIYYEPQRHSGQALPQWEENNEVFDGNPLLEKYPLQLAQTRTRFFVHSHFRGAAWLAQFYTGCIELNPQAMEERGLIDGDIVEVFNDRGTFSCPVYGNNAIRPTSARIYEAAWSKDCTSGNPQNVTNDHVNERDADLITGAPIPFNDTLVEVRKVQGE